LIVLDLDEVLSILMHLRP